MKRINIILCSALMTAVLFGCGSARMAQLTSDDPEKVIAEVTQIINKAEQEQVDLLADKEYLKGRDSLAKAKKGLARRSDARDILDAAAIAKAHFQDANKVAGARAPFAKRILKARKSALQAGLRKSPLLIDDLEDIDDDLRSETDMFTQALNPDDFSEFQQKYLILEVKAVQFRELNNIKLTIKKSMDNDADKLAPKTLMAAQLDLKEADNIIGQSPRNPGIYNKGVQKSLVSSVLLADTMKVILNAKGTPEHIALKIVAQTRALGTLNTNVGKLTANLKSTKLTLKAKEGALKAQDEQLERASTQIRFQQAMDEARKQLLQSDALVYQQGNTLVFRLKRINFKSGAATIPAASAPLLTKVNSIITKLDAEKVIVQGYTDSIGAADFNQRLSTRRATSVATFLSRLRGDYKIEYAGYGESKPIESNETARGRAINRRVDLVVTAKK